MQPNPHANYGTPNGGGVPVRYMIPTVYRHTSPPFANQAYNRYSGQPENAQPTGNYTQPIRYPAGYVHPSTRMPYDPYTASSAYFPPPVTSPEQIQPPQPYYYNPNTPAQQSSVSTPDSKATASKKGVKEYKDNAFTIAPDGADVETIKGLVSNNDINELLKHKGTKVKVSKIYRITKTKPEILKDDSSDDDLPLPKDPPRSKQSLPSAPALTPVPKSAPILERSSSSSSSCSHCSTCSNCSCTDCRDRRRSHTYDDCPECRAEWERGEARRRRR